MYHVVMRTTVTLDDDVYEAALCQAKATGRRLGSVLSEMARHALRGDLQPGPTAGQSGRFPAFDVPSDAALIPNSRVQRVLDEHGIV